MIEALAQQPRRVLVAAGVAAVVALSGCGSLVPVSTLTPCSTPGPVSQADSFKEQVPLTATSDGLQYGDFRLGCGAEVRSGEQVGIEYTGWLSNGTKFDSSRDTGRQKFTFALGAGQVLPGVEEGVKGMRVGGKRRLVVPPALAFGAQGVSPVIPPNATVIFDVEVVSAS